MRMLRIAGTSLLVWLPTACGGSVPPSESASSRAAEQETAASPASSSGTTAASASAEGDATPTTGPASDEDVRAVLQLVVDDPELDAHLHLGEPGRFPLKVAGPLLPRNLKLVKATEPVKVAETPTTKQDAVLVFTAIEIQGDRATVRYRYDIEGIRGTVTLAKSPHGWELRQSRVVEH